MRMEQGARIVVERWLEAKPDDVLHFITDETKLQEAEAFAAAAEACCAVPKITVLPSCSVQAGDSIEEMRRIMSYANAIVGATSYSFITTDAVNYALRHGARFLSLPLSTNDGKSLLENDFLLMEPGKALQLARPVLPFLRCASVLHVKTALGTDLTLSIKGRKPGVFRGLASRPGVCASASFEIFLPPVETETNGILVLDGSMGYLGLVDKPLTLTFQNGYLADIPDTPDGRRLRQFMEGFHDPEMYCVSEFGIGLNQLARCRGASYIEDESAYGTFHLGLGRNLALGGTHNAAGHFDIVAHHPTITAGRTVIMQDGVIRPGIIRK